MRRRTYGASGDVLSPGAGVVAQLRGSAARVVCIVGVWTESDSPLVQVLERYSTLAAGGAVVTPARVPFDPLETASVAILELFTAVPVAGVLIGEISRFNAGAAGVAGYIPYARYFGRTNLLVHPVTLRGATDTFVLRKITAVASVNRFSIEWTEQ